MSTQFDSDVAAIDRTLTDYRERIAEYECFVTKLHKLLMEARDDDAMDLVRDKFIAIHGPDV